MLVQEANDHWIQSATLLEIFVSSFHWINREYGFSVKGRSKELKLLMMNSYLISHHGSIYLTLQVISPD